MKNLAMFHILLPTIKELLLFSIFFQKESGNKFILPVGSKPIKDAWDKRVQRHKSTKLKSASFHFLCVIWIHGILTHPNWFWSKNINLSYKGQSIACFACDTKAIIYINACLYVILFLYIKFEKKISTGIHMLVLVVFQKQMSSIQNTGC